MSGNEVAIAIVLRWEAFKVWLSASTGLSHHDYHVLLGIGLTLGLTRLLRLPLGSWLPVSLVFTLELINEAFDFARYYIDRYPCGPEPMLIDIPLTMAAPLAIVVAARLDTTRASTGDRDQSVRWRKLDSILCKGLSAIDPIR